MEEIIALGAHKGYYSGVLERPGSITLFPECLSSLLA